MGGMVVWDIQGVWSLLFYKRVKYNSNWGKQLDQNKLFARQFQNQKMLKMQTTKWRQPQRLMKTCNNRQRKWRIASEPSSQSIKQSYQHFPNGGCYPAPFILPWNWWNRDKMLRQNALVASLFTRPRLRTLFPPNNAETALACAAMHARCPLRICWMN